MQFVQTSRKKDSKTKNCPEPKVIIAAMCPDVNRRPLPASLSGENQHVHTVLRMNVDPPGVDRTKENEHPVFTLGPRTWIKGVKREVGGGKKREYYVGRDNSEESCCLSFCLLGWPGQGKGV